MNPPALPINRILRHSVTCGIVGGILTWLLHLFLKGFLRAASPLAIEGTTAFMSGSATAALLGFLISRSVKRSGLRILLSGILFLLVPFAIVVEGIGGMIGARYAVHYFQMWIPLRANADHVVVVWGYFVAPVLWTLLLWRVVTWYYKSRYAVSLHRFHRPTADTAGVIHPIDRDIRQLCLMTVLSVTAAWGIHRWVVGFRNPAEWQTHVEAAPILLAAGITASIAALWVGRSSKWQLASSMMSGPAAIVVGIVVGYSGWVGFLLAHVLIRLANFRIDYESTIYGYYLFPPAWAMVFAWIACWYYRATHGGASLLDFEPLQTDVGLFHRATS